MNKKLLISLIREEINKVDPIGLLSMGAPKDEYNPEIEEIVKKLDSLRNFEEIETLVYKTFVKMFGLKIAGSRERYSEVAENILRKINRSN